MNAAELKNAPDNSLPQSYHWNRAQSRLSVIAAAAFAGLALVASQLGSANKPDVNELCAPENVACHEFVEEQIQQDKFFLAGLFLVFGTGIALSRASQFYRRAEEIKQEHEGPNLL